MKRGRHLSSLEVLATVFEPAAPRSAVAGHLAECSRCVSDVDDLRALRSHYRQGVAEPPASVVLRACALMPAVLPKRVELGRFLIARIVHDAEPAEARYAVRGPAMARHQVWRAAGADIDVHIEGPGLGSEPLLIGQVLPRDPIPPGTEGNIWLTEGRSRPQWAPISGSGEFCLPTPRGRRWTLWIEWGGIRARMRVP